MTEQKIAQRRYWFPAKSYGWGWGLPSAWQGWLVLALFAALMVLGVLLFPPAQAALAYSLYSAALGAALVAVCWLTGEPPRRRRGGK